MKLRKFWAGGGGGGALINQPLMYNLQFCIFTACIKFSHLRNKLARTIYTCKVVASEVNLRECISHMPPSSVNKAAQSGF